MMRIFTSITRVKIIMLLFLCTALVFGSFSTAHASEEMYRTFMLISSGKGDATLFEKLNTESRKLDWSRAKNSEFEGTLRHLKVEGASGDSSYIYMVRDITGRLHVLSVPPADSREAEGSLYARLSDLMGNKFVFKVQELEAAVAGQTFSFVRLLERPSQLAFDRIFKISIVLMLFFVMVGMGLTLTVADFKRVFQKPKGMLTGAVLQWLLMPLIAVGLGRFLGFYEAYPFIFVGMVLIAVSPGGVTSNLMTYYAKGDLALSISLTSFSTVLSLVFTPLLLAFYCANVPEVTIPVGLVVQTIIILVIIPLAAGMTVQARWPNFASKATPFFSILGVIALLFLIIAGILGNLEVFTDTGRYGFKFYSMVFILTLLGMITGALFPKLLRISNYQTRAISLETGLRNASLAMALALLIQDFMGDFYSSMFVTSAMFGLLMYIAGFLSIGIYKKLLPVEGEPEYEMKFNTDDEV
jgi:BASS family bile acid:Na+ symporter